MRQKEDSQVIDDVIIDDAVLNPRITKVSKDRFTRGRLKNVALIICRQNVFLPGEIYYTINLVRKY